jgi:site-specific recombinase XerD
VTKDKTKVFHSLRKSFARALAEAGVPDEVTGAILGHSPVNKVTQLYTGKKPVGILKEAIEKVSFEV